MVSKSRLEELCFVLTKSGKKLEILLRQMKTFERFEKENQSSLNAGLISAKEYKKNTSRIARESSKVDKDIKKLLESLIREILKSTG